MRTKELICTQEIKWTSQVQKIVIRINRTKMICPLKGRKNNKAGIGENTC